MPVSTIIVLAGVVAVFAAFASALAWAQLQTRHAVIAGRTNKASQEAVVLGQFTLPRFADLEEQAHG
jgi:hypothetical protein